MVEPTKTAKMAENGQWKAQLKLNDTTTVLLLLIVVWLIVLTMIVVF